MKNKKNIKKKKIREPKKKKQKKKRRTSLFFASLGVLSQYTLVDSFLSFFFF